MVDWKNRNSRAAYGVKELQSLLGISRASIYRLFDNQKLIPCKVGSRTLVKREDLERFLETAQAADPSIWLSPGSKSTVHMDVLDWFTSRSGQVIRVWRRRR